MNTLNLQLRSLSYGALLLLAAATAAYADDTEIFFGNRTVSTPANILFVLDTSGSMAGHVSGPAAFNPTQTYTGTCSDSYYYFAAVGTDPTTVDCTNTSTRIDKSRFQCTAAQTALGNSSSGTGQYVDSKGGLIRWGNYTTTNTSSTVYTYTNVSSAACTGYATTLHGTKSYNPSTKVCTVTVITTTTNAVNMWQNNLSVAGGTDVECAADRPGVGTDSNYPDKASAASTVTGGQYTSTAANSWWSVVGNAGGPYVIFDANFINYSIWAPSSIQTRLSSVRNAADGLLNLLSGVNVGLMTYSYSGSGGMVRQPVRSIDATGVRTSMINEINSMVPAGDTPLSETLFEAYRYYSGGRVLFGGDGTNGTFASTACTSATPFDSGGGVYIGSCDSSANYPSAPASQNPAGTYDSPADYSCQKNYIVYLTDGEPTNDNEADSYMEGSSTSTQVAASTQAQCTALGGVWRTSRRGNTCTVTTITGGLPNWQSVTGGCVGTGSGRCTSALAKYMYQSDLRSDVSGTQNVKSYFIGFGSDFFDANTGTSSASFQFLLNAATAGGGQAYTATDYSSLTSVFGSIIADIAADVDTSFSAPSVAVNAFNRTQTLDDLYVSVFSPQTTMHWPGNLKKYKVTNEVVTDADGNAAVNPSTGFFKNGSRSYWSVTADGPDVTLGGAAHMLPDPSTRNVYTYLGSNKPAAAQSLTAIGTAITSANATSVLNLQAGDPVYTDLISWAKGTDVKHDNPPTDTSGVRHAMGDPVHSEPAVVIYAPPSGSAGNDTVVYVTTNDGYLHAINATANSNGTDASNSGQELWSFVPQEMLPDLRLLYADGAVTSKHYSLDGPVRVLKYDVNGDGAIQTAQGDRVLLYFTTGRSTSQSRYYALDVTDKNNPKFLWSLAAADLPGVGQTWSSPTVARVTVAGASQNGQHLVLIFGGGYDAVEDGYSFVNSDSVGNHLYMVDAKTGALLWTAGPSGANFNNARMTHAIPSTVTVLDVNNDGFADRMYVGDMAGQVWRFDITNGNTAANLVAGGVIASLGTKEDATHTMANTRRFYAAPDVALVEPVGARPFYSVAIGSGYRGHPVNTEVNDRMYSIRDYNPFGLLSQATYNGMHIALDSELIDVTSSLNPTLSDGAYGWKLRLTAAAGEKIVTASRTLANTVYFTSFSPGSTTTNANDPCSVQVTSGSNRVYAVSVLNAAPVKDRNGDGTVTLDDRSTALRQGGIAPGISLLFPGESTHHTDVLVMSGPETVDTCTSCRALRKTYWYDGSVQ